MILLGIDPGSAGGMAAWDGDKVWTMPNPKSEGDWVTIISDLGKGVQGNIAVIESVNPFLAGSSGTESAGAKIGMAIRLGAMMESYGFLRGVIQGQGWRTELVRPTKWQKALSLGHRKSHASQTAWKNSLKAEAQRLYPQIKVTLAISDALLILEYAQRMRFNAPQMTQEALV